MCYVLYFVCVRACVCVCVTLWAMLPEIKAKVMMMMITSLPKVIWEQGRVAAAVPGAGWHKGLRITSVLYL